MRICLKSTIGLFALILIGCAAQSDETYTPSIATLKSNETLVMKLSACHRGCTEGVVEFENNKAIFGNYNVELTTNEINELDRYFLSANDLDDNYSCSSRIMISFEKKRGLKSLRNKNALQHPCHASSENTISAMSLLIHFDRMGFDKIIDKTPYWRLPPEDQIFISKD